MTDMRLDKYQVDEVAARYTTDEIKAVCKQINDQIMHGNGAADEMLQADLIELQDEYSLWSQALERHLGHAGS